MGDTFGNGLITRIYRELKKLTLQRINNLMTKWVNELNRHFSKKEAILSILGHKGSVNQNDIDISSHSHQNGYHRCYK
jgi:hypothetical protein